MGQRIVIQVIDDGRDARKYHVDGRRLRRLAWLGVALLLVFGAAVAGGTWKLYASIGNGPSAQAENTVLRTRLQSLEGRLTRVDQTMEPRLDGGAGVGVPQIQPPVVGIDLQHRAGPGRGIDKFRQVGAHPFTATDQTPGGMAQDVHKSAQSLQNGANMEVRDPPETASVRRLYGKL